MEITFYVVFILLYLKNEELASEVEALTASLAKAREATHQAHIQKFKVSKQLMWLSLSLHLPSLYFYITYIALCLKVKDWEVVQGVVFFECLIFFM